METKSVEDRKSLQPDANSLQQWCGGKHTEIYVQKSKLYIPHAIPAVSILIAVSMTFQFFVLTTLNVLLLS
jgi:hypothetical protein